LKIKPYKEGKMKTAIYYIISIGSLAMIVGMSYMLLEAI
jgi:hypothetical protein